MATESPADLASFFDEDEFGESASYLGPGPADVAVACTVVVDRGQGRDVVKDGRAPVGVSERNLTVQRFAIAKVQKDGVFTVTDPVSGAPERLKVVGVPKLEHTGRVWSVQLVIGG